MENNYPLKILCANHWNSTLSKLNWMMPFCKDFSRADELLAFCKSNQIRVVLGNSSKLQYLLTRNSDFFSSGGLYFLCNSLKLMNIVVDKRKFYDYMLNNSMNKYVARQYNLSEVAAPCDRRLIVKPKLGSNSRGVRVVEAGGFVGNLGDDFIVSEYIFGNEEYASNILFKDGKIAKHVTYRKKYGESADYLNSITRAGMVDERCIPVCLDILEDVLLKINGEKGFCVCCIDYKVVDKTPKIFEINSRLGYTLACNSSDFKEMIELYVRLATEQIALHE